MEGMGRAWEAFPSRQGNLPFAAWQGNPVCGARKGAAGSLRGGFPAVQCRNVAKIRGFLSKSKVFRPVPRPYDGAEGRK